MLIDAGNLIKKVASVHDSGQDVWQDDSTLVRRVRGGMNNALYYLHSDDLEVACKLCVPDDRQRAHREYHALSLMHNSGVNLAPVPLAYDDNLRWLPYPVVIYKWLPGKPLGGSLSPGQWDQLIVNYQRLHSLRSDEVLDQEMPTAFFHWLDREPYLDELHVFLSRFGPWLRQFQKGGAELLARLRDLVQRCGNSLYGNDVDISLSGLALCLCRVDPNPANIILGPDKRMRWVDWEFSGWGDAALEISDLGWHAAIENVHSAEQIKLRSRYLPPEGDHTFYDRMALWDSLLSVRWPFLVLRLLWSTENGPDRLRLTRPIDDQATLWARLIRLVERAENWYETGSY